jgi:hypothetical protein
MNESRFPLYVVSHDRATTSQTIKELDRWGTEFNIVIESSDYEAYADEWGEDRLLVVPQEYHEQYETYDDLGFEKPKGPGPARNFVWDHSKEYGYDWHWVMDDNITHFYYYNDNKYFTFDDDSVFRAMEDFVLQYKNISMAGPHYSMFVARKDRNRPMNLNTRVYSCNLIRNDTGYRWAGRYNEDTDLSLRMLKDGWCTVQFRVFQQDKIETQQVDGGNTENFYKHEGTYNKSKMLKLCHPDVTEIRKKYGRWHHYVDYKPFKNQQLIKKDNPNIEFGEYDFNLSNFAD